MNALEMGDHAFRLMAQSRYDDALALCDKIIASWPHAYVGHHRKGQVLARMGEHDLALKCKTRVVDLQPDEAFAYFGRARQLMEMARFREAVADLDEAERRDDGYFGPVIPLLRAECQLELGNLDACEADCAKVPDDVAYPMFMGRGETSKHDVLDDVRRRRQGRSG